MKTLVFLICFCLCTLADAQFSQEYSFSTPLYKHAPYHNSLGVTLMSPDLFTGSEKSKATELRVGIDFEATNWGKLEIQGVPMISPGGKFADVKVSTSGIKTNMLMRFSFPYDNFLTPYFDVFAGWRNFSGTMIVSPHDSGVYVPSFKFYKANRFNFGGTAGVIVSFSSCLKLNAGIQVSCLGAPVSLPDLHHAYVENTSLIFNRKPAQNYTAMFKLGIVLVFNDDLSDALSFLNGCTIGGGDGCGGGGGSSSRSSSSSGGGGAGTKGKVDVIVK